MLSTLAVTLSSLALAGAQAPQPVPGVTGKLGDAKVETGNPAGVTYTAVLPERANTGIRGYISATSSADGNGVSVNLNVYGFPTLSLGPFMYHIHDQPIPANGNCTAALAHLDPYVRGEVPPCLPSAPQTCQSGDLSGKHGNITSQAGLQTSYSDLYLSTRHGPGAFLGNRSIVFHTSNATRLTCANFVLSSSGSNATNSTGGAGTTGGLPTPPSPSISSFPGGSSATANVVGATALLGLAGVAVAFLL